MDKVKKAIFEIKKIMKVGKVSNSIIIPKRFLKTLKWDENSILKIYIKEKKIIIEELEK